MSSSSTASKSQGEAIASGLEVVDSVTSGVMKQRPSPKRELVVHSAREGCSPSVTPQKPAEHPNPEACIPQSDSGIAHEEKLQTPDSGVNVAHPGQIGNTPFVIREKALDDGYNWRKYGQKNVKGNEFIRSYYRCTQCQAKKQLDCSSEGRITNTVYFGQHNHPRPHQNPPLAVGFAVSIVEGKTVGQSTNHAAGKSLGQHSQPPRHSEPSVTHELSIVPSSVDLKNMDSAHLESSRVRDGTDNDDAPDSKRQKKSKSNVAPAPVDKHAGDPRMVVQSVSDADIVEDGYRWRKYGQKLVKGNPNPRSYYRCSTPGCPVKKHVERASDDPKVVVTTYEGKHDHDMPPSRTVTPKASGSNTPPVPLTGQSGTKSEEYGNHSIDKVGHSVLSPESNADEHQNGKPSTKLDQTEGLGSNIISSHSGQEIRQSREQIEKLGAESKPNEQNNGGEQIEKLGAENKPNEQQNGGEQIEKLGSESKPNEQQNGEEQIEKLGAENKPNEEQNGFSSEKGDAADPKTSAQSCAGLDSTSTGLLNDNLRESHVVNAVAHVRPGCEGNSSEQQRSNSEPIKS